MSTRDVTCTVVALLGSVLRPVAANIRRTCSSRCRCRSRRRSRRRRIARPGSLTPLPHLIRQCASAAASPPFPLAGPESQASGGSILPSPQDVSGTKPLQSVLHDPGSPLFTPSSHTSPADGIDRRLSPHIGRDSAPIPCRRSSRKPLALVLERIRDRKSQADSEPCRPRNRPRSCSRGYTCRSIATRRSRRRRTVSVPFLMPSPHRGPNVQSGLHLPYPPTLPRPFPRVALLARVDDAVAALSACNFGSARAARRGVRDPVVASLLCRSRSNRRTADRACMRGVAKCP